MERIETNKREEDDWKTDRGSQKMEYDLPSISDYLRCEDEMRNLRNYHF